MLENPVHFVPLTAGYGCFGKSGRDVQKAGLEWPRTMVDRERLRAIPESAAALGADGVTPIKIDLTGNNVSGNALLNDLGGLRIPLLIVMTPSGEEVFRGDFYTIKQVLEAIKQAKDH